MARVDPVIVVEGGIVVLFLGGRFRFKISELEVECRRFHAAGQRGSINSMHVSLAEEHCSKRLSFTNVTVSYLMKCVTRLPRKSAV